jgi:catechol 2,3-dioxygenase-like lactoylglutathione lyase family enzyme
METGRRALGMAAGLRIVPELAVTGPRRRGSRCCARSLALPGRADLLVWAIRRWHWSQADSPPGMAGSTIWRWRWRMWMRRLPECWRAARGWRRRHPMARARLPNSGARGVRYVFLEGPEGRGSSFVRVLVGSRDGLPGHDHIGIPCADLAATEAFFLGLGFAALGGERSGPGRWVTRVRFLGLGASVVELYEPPAPARGRAPVLPRALWRGIGWKVRRWRRGCGIGPDGLRVTVVWRNLTQISRKILTQNFEGPVLRGQWPLFDVRVSG